MRKLLWLAAAVSALSFGAAHATTVVDPAGDILPTFAGGNIPDLDVTSFSVGYNATTQDFTLKGTMAGVINQAGTDVFVIGADTGTGPSHPFGALGAPKVKFNQVISIKENGATTIGANTLTASISGADFSLTVPLADLPSTGKAADRYGFNLWPENATRSISDFAPNNGVISAVPEPGVWALMLVGVAGVGGALRRSRRVAGTMAAI